MKLKQKDSKDLITKLQAKLAASENLANELEERLLARKQRHDQKQAHIEDKLSKTKYQSIIKTNT